jgi:hypothetical protein
MLKLFAIFNPPNCSRITRATPPSHTTPRQPHAGSSLRFHPNHSGTHDCCNARNPSISLESSAAQNCTASAKTKQTNHRLSKTRDWRSERKTTKKKKEKNLCHLNVCALTLTNASQERGQWKCKNKKK